MTHPEYSSGSNGLRRGADLARIFALTNLTERQDIDFILSRLGQCGTLDERHQVIRSFRNQLIQVGANEALDGAAQQPIKPGPDDRSIPSRGQIPWEQLGRDVMDAMYAERTNYEFDQSYYPGHQMLPQMNFNSLARIVDKYRYYGASPVPSTQSQSPVCSGCDKPVSESECAIAWTKWWHHDCYHREADRRKAMVSSPESK